MSGPSNGSPHVAIIGAGPAGLMAAEAAGANGARVTVFDRMPSAGRKFLLAGRGGLNLTHSEPSERFLTRYGAATPHLRHALEAFDASALRDWCEELGCPTFVGTSGRIFPSTMKSSPLLRAWLRRLASQNVQFALRHDWQGCDDAGALSFETPDGPVRITPDAAILALGGASWPRLGSDGRWTSTLRDMDVEVAALEPANCGFSIAWSDIFKDRFEGQPLKSISVRCDGFAARGDAVVTRSGVEGGAIYAISAAIRNAITRNGRALMYIGLRPDMATSDIATKLDRRQAKWSLSTTLRKTLRLSPLATGLLREAAERQNINLANLSSSALAELINAVPIDLDAPMPLARAISTAGGVAFGSVDDDFMLRRRPGVFVAGEMLDWEAPTGGYLLQACFATGRLAGDRATQWAKAQSKRNGLTAF